MQLTLLSMVVEECIRDLADEGATHIHGYYFHENEWKDSQTKEAATGTVAADLTECLQQKKPYRSQSSIFSNFILPEIQGVVRAEFGVRMQRQRLDALQRVVQRSYRNASNAFAVKYNSMTGLLAKVALHELIDQKLKELASFKARDKDPGEDETNPPALCVLALDIDHFKQVNDSFGHAYGDVVIEAFAIRVQRAAEAFCNESATNLQATCAHVSGEEFFCVAWGEAETLEFEKLARALLLAVSERELPTQSEFELVSLKRPRDVVLPQVFNRTVTCSVGGVVNGVPTSQDTQISVAKLLHQADLALYKSKNQGRNRTTFFPSILQSGGRVLEHRKDVQVCVIDIGLEVGVTKGQEFLVYHPEFTGQVPYVFDDGRSKKVLGWLPRVPLCTITAFDVQQSIAFCRPEPRFADVGIPANAALEEIPLGTLAVAIPVAGIVGTEESIGSVVSIADTLSRIAVEVDGDSEVSFAVVAIRNESQLLAEHGFASVNRSLAMVCRALQKIPDFEFLGQIEPTKLLMQFATYDGDQRKQLDDALQQAEKESNGRAKFVAGVYAPRFGRVKNEPELPKFRSLKTRVDLARYAASPEGVLDDRVHEFTYYSADLVLSNLRALRAFERGMADYEHFLSLGISGPALDNLAGLLASGSGNLALAESYYLKAADQAPATDTVYRLNAIVVQARQGNYASAVTTASKIDAAALEAKYIKSPAATAALAISLAECVLLGDEAAPPVSQALLWLKRALDFENLSIQNRARLASLMEKLNS